MKTVFAVTVALSLLCLGGIVQADVFNLGTGFTNLETVPVGNPGNTGELSGAGAGEYGPDRICGSVGYNYNIGKYEVTAKQYADFLNAKAKTDTYGLYHDNMWGSEYGCKIQQTGTSGSYTYSVANDWANRPVNWVSYWDTCRFANWLGNGQGDGDTENGAYTLGGYNGDDGRTIQRNPGWKWAVTSEDEWYKAAYFKGGGTNAGYWDYPTQSDIPTTPSNDITNPDGGNNANFYQNGFSLGTPYYLTNVGEFENSESAYGTFDQGGNIWEWTETIVWENQASAYRGLRGGSFDGTGNNLRASSRFYDYYPTLGGFYTGFRVSAVVPEPAYGISNRAAYHTIISTAFVSFNFKVWGKVTILGSGSFDVDDGSGTVVRVVAPGFGGIQDGDYASAKGKFSGEGSNRVLNAQASDVVKLR